MSSEAALDDFAVNADSPSVSPSPEPADNASTANGRPNDKSKKRASADDGSEPPHKVTKRRAARACVSCRARKVRCDVVEGAPCGNCRWDNVEVCSLWHIFRLLRETWLSHPICNMANLLFPPCSALSRRAAGESEFSHQPQCNQSSPVYIHSTPIHIHTRPSFHLHGCPPSFSAAVPDYVIPQRISALALRT